MEQEMAATSWLFNPHIMDDRQVQIFWDIDVSAKSSQVINEKFIPSYFNLKAAQLQNPLIVSCRVVLIFFYSQFFFNLDSSSEGEI